MYYYDVKVQRDIVLKLVRLASIYINQNIPGKRREEEEKMAEFTITGFADEISEKIVEQFSYLNKLSISWFEPRGIDGKNISDLNEEETEALKKKMEEFGIKVSSIGSPIGKIGITDDFEAHIEKLQNTIRVAKALGTKYIRMFSFYIPEGKYGEYRSEVIRRLKAMVEVAKAEGIILLHENEKGIYADKADRCLDILKTVDSPNFRAVFDPANFVQCGQDTKEAFEMLKPYVVYMHIKDALADGSVVPAGYGIGNVEWILTQLKEEDYHGFLSLEPHLGSFKGLENLELDDHMLELKGSTPEKFKLAHDALKAILVKIGA